ncbi:uncharacterized protein [Palaemon carinicauda]|uniref:uncharacterized protein n=1 Tax=Palaemon carinicauda TaxID=392227 RepID=UPI0035B6456B
MRVATLNVGTMTGKGREVVDFMERRKIGVLSGGMESQTDLLLCKRDHLTEVRNCKEINGESIAEQHRIGGEVLGKSSGRRPLNDEESWWWNDEVQERVKTKKETKKKADLSRKEQDKENYKQAKKEAKRAVAKAKEAVNKGVTRREVEQAVKKMKNSKASGPDNIPVEVWKSLGEEGIDILWDPMQKIFNQEKMLEEWRGSVIISICKGRDTSRNVATTEA